MPRRYPVSEGRPRQFWRRAGLHVIFVALAATGLYLSTSFERPSDLATLTAAQPEGSSVTDELARALSQAVPIDAPVRNPVLANASLAGEEDISAAARAGSAEVRPVYFTVLVDEGDTVGKLADAFAVDSESIIVNNPGIEDPNFLLAGQEITIPGASGIIHAVRFGESIEDIARTYGTTPTAIRKYSGNADAFDPSGRLRQGVAILAVGGEIQEGDDEGDNSEAEADPDPTATPTPEPTADPTEAPTAEPTEEPTEEPTPEPTPEPTAEPTPEPTEEPTPEPTEEPAPDPTPDVDVDPTPSGRFVWPVAACGPFSENQKFQNSQRPDHGGLDIPLFCSPAAAVVAADGGTVTLADWNGGYGLMVVIDHGNGFETWYAHLSQVTVSPGQSVGQGELVGYSGCTGSCYGEHLHFEVHHNGVRVDPLSYLP